MPDAEGRFKGISVPALPWQQPTYCVGGCGRSARVRAEARQGDRVEDITGEWRCSECHWDTPIRQHWSDGPPPFLRWNEDAGEYEPFDPERDDG